MRLHFEYLAAFATPKSEEDAWKWGERHRKNPIHYPTPFWLTAGPDNKSIAAIDLVKHLLREREVNLKARR